MKATGRPPFRPTRQQRRLVEVLIAVGGFGQKDIAAALSIDPKTLRRAFPTELKHGAITAQAAVLGALFTAAVGGHVAAGKFLFGLISTNPAASASRGRSNPQHQTRAVALGKKAQAAADATLPAPGGWADLIDVDKPN